MALSVDDLKSLVHSLNEAARLVEEPLTASFYSMQRWGFPGFGRVILVTAELAVNHVSRVRIWLIMNRNQNAILYEVYDRLDLLHSELEKRLASVSEVVGAPDATTIVISRYEGIRFVSKGLREEASRLQALVDAQTSLTGPDLLLEVENRRATAEKRVGGFRPAAVTPAQAPVVIPDPTPPPAVPPPTKSRPTTSVPTFTDSEDDGVGNDNDDSE